MDNQTNPSIQNNINALILDDSVFDRQRIRRLTKDTNLRILINEAATLEALDSVLDEEKFDVIFIDYYLPEGDGLDALERIRSHHINRDCPAIMVTGKDNSEVAVKSLKMGCTDYVCKDDLTAASLRRCVIEAVEQSGPDEEHDAMFRAGMDRAVADVMNAYADALQPPLAELIRSLRRLRNGGDRPVADIQSELAAMERQCIGIWAALLERDTGQPIRKLRH